MMRRLARARVRDADPEVGDLIEVLEVLLQAQRDGDRARVMIAARCAYLMLERLWRPV